MYDVYAVREDFPVLKEVVYLDSTATTQTPIPAVEAMVEYFYWYAGKLGIILLRPCYNIIQIFFPGCAYRKKA